MIRAGHRGSERSDEIGLAELLRRAGRARFRVAILALAGLAIGLVLTLLQPQQYRSTAVVFAPTELRFVAVEVGLESDARPRVVTQDTEAAFVRSGTVLSAANSRERGDATITAGRLDITVPPGTRAIHISYTASDPHIARKATELVSEEYVRVRNDYFDRRRARLTEQLVGRRDEIRAELADVRELTADAETDLRAIPSLRSRAADLRAQLDAMETATTEVMESSATPAGVVRAPSLPRRPQRANAEVPPLSGLAGGLLVGLAWGVGTDRRRGVLHDVPDVTAASGLPIRARFTSTSHAVDPDAVAQLATEIRLRAPETVLLTGAGADLTAVGTLAEQLRTALHDGDPDGPDTAAPLLIARTGEDDDAPMLRSARDADLTLVVVDLGRSSRTDLVTADRLLTYADARPELVLTEATGARPNGSGHG